MDSTIAEDMDFQISNNFILHRFGNDLFMTQKMILAKRN